LKLKFFIQTPSVLNNCTLCLAFVHGDFLTTAGNSITFVIVLPRKRNGSDISALNTGVNAEEEWTVE